MRKIENRNDFLDFIFDAEENIKSRETFAILPEDKDYSDEFFWVHADGFIYDEDGELYREKEFVSSVEERRSYPFFVCPADNDAHFDWL